MQVRRNDGVAIHIGPEPCVVVRKGGGEASVGEQMGNHLAGSRGDAANAVLAAAGYNFRLLVPMGQHFVRMVQLNHLQRSELVPVV